MEEESDPLGLLKGFIPQGMSTDMQATLLNARAIIQAR